MSRNNDLDGYWALGKLRRRFEQVQFDLLAKQISPPSADFQRVVDQYAEWLQNQLGVRLIPSHQVRVAAIRLRFNVQLPKAEEPPRTTRGSLFECEVELGDDLGKLYSARRFGWCAPHEPAREMRSARV